MSAYYVAMNLYEFIMDNIGFYTTFKQQQIKYIEKHVHIWSHLKLNINIYC
jgi:hypothetical protein